MPDLAWEYLYLSLAALNQQSVTLDLDGQVIPHPNHALRKGTVLIRRAAWRMRIFGQDTIPLAHHRSRLGVRM
jgi:hypothetical protein